MYLSALPIYFLGKTDKQSRSPSPTSISYSTNSQENPDEFRIPSPTPSDASFKSADYGELLADPETAMHLIESHKKLTLENKDLAKELAEARQQASAATYYADKKEEEANHWKQQALSLQRANQALRETVARSLHKPAIPSPLTPKEDLRKAVLQPQKRPLASQNTGTVVTPAKRIRLDSEETVEDNK